mgnify:CR=1 FL=1
MSEGARAFVDALPEGLSRETAIRRDALGRWWNGEVAISHPNVSAAFDGWIRRAEDDRLCLVNDINWAYVVVEGAPYVVRHVRFEESVKVELSGGAIETLDTTTLRLDASGRLYCDVLGGTLAASFSRAAMGELADAFGEEGTTLTLQGVCIPLQTVHDPLAPFAKAERAW